jgi:ABC-type branched-subunit amino acid transport system ATPase component
MPAAPVPLLKVRALSKRFGGVHALRDVSLILEPGRTLGMIGPNGSGKTTFVNAVSGNLRPDSGQILLEGQEVGGLTPHRLAALGLVRTYQAVRVFAGLSVAENIRAAALLLGAGGLSPEERGELTHWLQLEHLLQRRAGALTLFEQRRLELVMRLALRPRLVMLDEPVGGLSSSEVSQMIRLLAELKTRCGLFVIEHTMRVIRELADRVVVLVAGEKIADGPPEQIMRERRVIDEYLGNAHA